MALPQSILQRGLRSAQPSPTDVAAGVLYYVTDEGVTEQSDGTNWVTYSDTGAGGVGSIVISAGTLTASRSSLVFSNSNNVSFGLNGSTITADFNVAFSAQGGSSTFKTLGFSNANNVSFSNSNGSVVGNAVFNISAPGSSNNISNLVFSNSNGVTFGLSGSTVTASFSGGGGGGGDTLSYYENIPTHVSSVNIGNLNVSQVHVHPFFLQYNLSGSYIRQMKNPMMTQQGLAGTSANTTWTYGNTITFAYVVYTAGTGASSRSLQSVFSNSVQSAINIIVGAGAVGSNFSVTYNITYPVEGVTSTFSTSYAATSASYTFSTGPISDYIANAGASTFIFVDIPFATSMSPGNYWVAFGRSQSSASTGAPAGINQQSLQVSDFGVPQFSNLVKAPGSTGSLPFQFGNGSFSTNSAFMTTQSINMLNITTRISQAQGYFQVRRET